MTELSMPTIPGRRRFRQRRFLFVTIPALAVLAAAMGVSFLGNTGTTTAELRHVVSGLSSGGSQTAFQTPRSSVDRLLEETAALVERVVSTARAAASRGDRAS